MTKGNGYQALMGVTGVNGETTRTVAMSTKETALREAIVFMVTC